MTARTIDGKAAAIALRERVAASVARFEEQTGRAPGLATVLVGEDPASAVYVRSKGNATAEAGMAGFAHNLDATTSETELLELIARLNAEVRKASAAPARDTASDNRIRPSVHGDANTVPRMRWHSFLPGMFR